MDKYRCKDTEVTKNMRQDKRKWVDHLAMETEEAARNGRMKEVHDILKTLSKCSERQMWKFINGRIGQKGAMKEHFE